MTIDIFIGDCEDRLRALPAGCAHTCVTSPPYYGLRDYGAEGQIGLEQSPDAYVDRLVSVFREVRRVLRDDGTLWLNLGDCYLKKQRLLLPSRVALALQADGWVLRDEIVWHKPRTTPSSVKDRTVAAHEMIYLFAKQPTYSFDYLAIEEPSKFPGLKRASKKAFRDISGANGDAQREKPMRDIIVRETRRKRSVWSVSPSPYKDAHFATYPPGLIEPCILAGCPVGGTVLDPFGGAGTTALVAAKHDRNSILIEINPDYAAIARRRLGLATEGDALEALFA